ncbi:MAG: heparan-alpha-glucosaminide N-acetyltransferase domain-containing protein [Xanthomonadales bacterium]|nr:heparan-alpha-glucosaminide N-acetyltransferase domain-containing protein [Xanthomonadales bacterium]
MDSDQTASGAASNKKRLLSLDFFRGITIAAMILVNNPGSWAHVYPPLLHAKWHGWTATDLIFPFFLFIVGVSITLAFSAKKENHLPSRQLHEKIVRRTLILFALGLFLSGFPFYDFSSIRIPGVLQRIAVCYFFASLIFLHGSVKSQVAWTVGLLLIYWAAMQWFPVPGVGAGSYEKGANFSAWVDSLFLQGHMWSVTKSWDPEGIFSTVPAISTTLIGVLTGHLLLSEKAGVKKVSLMLGAGCVAIAIGSVWQFWLPINKSLWTSSYALFTGGMAMVVFGVSYYLIDIKGWRRGTGPFCVYGMNAITVFVLSGMVGRLLYEAKWESGDSLITLKEWLLNMLFLPWLSPINASLVYALVFVFLSYILMYYLYIKQIFIKI